MSLALGTTLALVSPLAAHASGTSPVSAANDPADAQALLNAVNGARATAGLSPLSGAADLATTALSHSWAMAEANDLFHNPSLPSAIRTWISLGENVGVGNSASEVATAFLASPEHRQNILSPAFSQVGLGVVDVGGTLWVTEDFRQPLLGTAHLTSSTPAPAPAGPTTLTTPAPATAPVRSAVPTATSPASSHPASLSTHGGPNPTPPSPLPAAATPPPAAPAPGAPAVAIERSPAPGRGGARSSRLFPFRPQLVLIRLRLAALFLLVLAAVWTARRLGTCRLTDPSVAA